MTWKIEATSGDFIGQQLVIDRDMLVGRHQQADIVLQSAQISRRHAAFLLKDEQIWLQDLNSSNGTFVNDVRISEEVCLKAGDMIRFDGMVFKVLAPEADTAVVTEKTATVSDSMPSLAERAGEVSITAEGMPQAVAIPKPAPIAEGVQVQAQPEPQPVAMAEPVSRVQEEKEQQKNASIGLLTLIVLIILAILAWVFLK